MEQHEILAKAIIAAALIQTTKNITYFGASTEPGSEPLAELRSSVDTIYNALTDPDQA